MVYFIAESKLRLVNSENEKILGTAELGKNFSEYNRACESKRTGQIWMRNIMAGNLTVVTVHIDLSPGKRKRALK